jgi:uncharacterized membrane protein
MVEKGYIGRAIQIVATNPFEYLFAGVVLGGLVLFTAGILIGPAAGGIAAMTLKRCRGQEIDLADAFSGFENFTTTVPVGLALALMVGFGTLFFVLPGWLLAALFSFSLPVAIDRPVGPGEAIRQGRLLAAKDLLAQVIFVGILAVLALSGAVFFVIGMCATVPVAIAALTVAYYETAYPVETAPGAADL